MSEEANQKVPRRIGSKKLADLLKTCRGHEADVKESTGQISTLIRAAVEKSGLNRGVFSLMRRLDRMPVQKLAIFLEDFDYYVVATGLKSRAESAPSFEATAPAAVENEDEETSEPAEVVSLDKRRRSGNSRSGKRQPDAAE